MFFFFHISRRPPISPLFPYTTLFRSYLRLGKIAPADVFGYVLAQFAGGFAGVLVARVVLGRAVADAAVNYAATVDRKSTRLNSSHRCISYAVFCLKKKKWTKFTRTSA